MVQNTWRRIRTGKPGLTTQHPEGPRRKRHQKITQSNKKHTIWRIAYNYESGVWIFSGKHPRYKNIMDMKIVSRAAKIKKRLKLTAIK